MSDRNENSITKVGEEYNFLAEFQDADASVEGLTEYRILPRIKVIQAMSDGELKKTYGEGSAILSPGNAMICDSESSFLFVPVFFFVEFCLWSDRRDNSSQNILERTFDANSELASRSRDADRRSEQYEGGPPTKPFTRRYVEHLNFAGMIYGDHDLQNTPCVLQFARGEFGKGRAFINSIMLRKVNGQVAPLWSQVWRFTPGLRNGDEGDWYGLDFSAPEVPFIQRNEVDAFRGLHTELKTDFDAKRLGVDMTEEESDVNDGEDDQEL